jgi:hypothetical protein
MVINIHWVGIQRLRGTNYFTHNELALINVVLNLTRLSLVNSEEVGTREAHLTEELAKLKLFETQVKGPAEKMLKSKDYHLSHSSVLLFSEEFMGILQHLAGLNQSEFNASLTTFSTGMSFGEELDEKLSFSYMRSFCKSLFYNSFFVASLAGCKSAFHSKPALRAKFETNEQLTMESLAAKVEETTSLIYAHLRDNVFVMDLPRSENDGNVRHHLDLGIEFSPLPDDNVSFLLNGEKAKVRFKEHLVRRKTNRPQVADELPIIFEEVPLLDDAALHLHATGEVEQPRAARRIEDDESDDDEEASGEAKTGFSLLVCFLPARSETRFYGSET